MKKPKPFLVVALLLAAFVTVAGMTTIEGEIHHARREQMAEVEGPTFIPVTTEEEFRAVLREGQAALFVGHPISTSAALSQLSVEAWVREARPWYPVYIAKLGDQPYIDRWFEQGGLGVHHQYYAGQGAVLWLRRGKVVTVLPDPGGQPPAQIRTQAEEAFGRDAWFGERAGQGVSGAGSRIRQYLHDDRRIAGHVKSRALGHVMANATWVQIGTNPDPLRGADLCFWSYAHLPKGRLPKG